MSPPFSSERVYFLNRRQPDHSHKKPRLKAPSKPPRPKPGERGALPYSPRDLDALWATAHSMPWVAFATLTTPSIARIRTWPDLKHCLKKLKQTLTNWAKRESWPPMLCATEFDQPWCADIAAHFHIVFAALLDDDQQAALCSLWLKLTNAPNNQGRIFNYRARGGGESLQRYIGKDIKGKGCPVKYPAPWLPERTECRLWFTIGLKHRPAREGAELRAKAGTRRRLVSGKSSSNCEAECLSVLPPKTSDDSSDSAHASAYITAVGRPVQQQSLRWAEISWRHTSGKRYHSPRRFLRARALPSSPYVSRPKVDGASARGPP